MGPFMQSVNPKFEEYLAKWNSGPLSCVSVFHKFVVIASTRDLARKVFNSPMYVNPCVVDVAKKILRPTNWVFLDGRQHVDYRKGLNGLFNRKSLAQYLPQQEEIYEMYFKRWLELSKKGKPRQYMGEFRDINCAVSLRTFCGTYIRDEAVAELRKQGKVRQAETAQNMGSVEVEESNMTELPTPDLSHTTGSTVSSSNDPSIDSNQRVEDLIKE